MAKTKVRYSWKASARIGKQKMGLILLLSSVLLLLTTHPSIQVNAATEPELEAAQSATATISASSVGMYGDFNNDGYDDLAIGVPFEDTTSDAAGGVNVIYGSAAGLTAAGDQQWGQNSFGIEDPSEPLDTFGSSLAIGDFNNDGFDDLAIGVPLEDIGTVQDAGAVNVIYGSAAGLNDVGDQFWHQDSSGVADTAEFSDHFGKALAAGDFDGDGYSDLAIGVWLEDTTVANSGAVTVLYGSSAGLSGSGDQFWHQDSSGILGANIFDDRFGYALGAGDFNDDGNDDLAVGVWGEDLGGIGEDDQGAVNVIYGTFSSGLGSAGNQLWTQDSTGVEEDPDDEDHFGNAFASGDFNGNGVDDLAIAVGGEDLGSDIDGGGVHVFYGVLSVGLQTSLPAAQFWTQDKSTMLGTSDLGDLFGASVAAGNFDDDAEDDLAIGIPGENSNGANNAGGVAVIYGAGSGLDAVNNDLWHQGTTTDSIEDSAEIGDNFGHSVATGDFNGNGFSDLATGIPLEDVSSVMNAGAVSVIYGALNGLAAAGDGFWHEDSSGIMGTAGAGQQFGAAVA